MKKILLTLCVIGFYSLPTAFAGMDSHGNPVIDIDLDTTEYAQSTLKNVQSIDLESDRKSIDLFVETLAYIKIGFYKDVDLSVCVPKILTGGVSECTDRYSFYLDPVEAKEEEKSFIDGNMEGIGAGLEINKDGGLKILNIYEGSPAEKAGLKENDIIIAVSSDVAKPVEDWADLRKMPIDQAIKLIRGPKGTTVNILIIRDGKREKVSVIRDKFNIKFLKSKIIKEKIGYIKISDFGGEVSDQFYKAMQMLDKDGAQSVIIDLRNNGGGKLNSVLDMCSWFSKTNLPYVTILYTKGRTGPYKDVTVAKSSVGKFKDKHIVVLQNGNSASASEIFSGYLKSLGAIVVGENSFGKGIVQTLISLSNNGRLHLTTSEYFIGSKMLKVHGIGISPTIQVKQDKPAKTEQEDVQLQRAILEAEKLLK